jgi:SAM-dependent methyltransferase
MSDVFFDNMAALYEESRTFDTDCFNGALEFLAERFPPKLFPSVFEPGIGTGRIAIPLARRGYNVTGIDISPEMLAVLEKRVAEPEPGLSVGFQKASATDVPFPDASFDIGIAVHLFYFIRNWQRAADELLRVVKPTGPIVLMHTGTGMEVPSMNDRYKELCADLGCPAETVGVRSTREVVHYLEGLGCVAECVQDTWCWTARIRLGRALELLKDRAYSFTLGAPHEIHAEAIDRMDTELRTRFADLDTVVEVPNQVYLVLMNRT